MDQIKVIKDWPGFSSAPYTAVSRKVVGKNVHATSSKGVWDIGAVEPTLTLANILSMVSDIVPFDSFKFLRKTVN